MPRFTTRDRARWADRQKWTAPRRAESQYSRVLRRIAKSIGTLVEGMAPGGKVEDSTRLTAALSRYAEMLQPWAQSVAKRMLDDVLKRDEQQWLIHGEKLAQRVRNTIQGAPEGRVYKQLMAEQVHLITSLPREAAQRVHELATRALSDSTRAAEIQRDILRTAAVTESRAKLIARTEVARASSVFVQARASALGSQGYIWRTSGDSDVRESHKEMEGKYVRWDSPPTLSDGTVTHAGQIYNCRCFPEPVLPDL